MITPRPVSYEDSRLLTRKRRAFLRGRIRLGTRIRAAARRERIQARNARIIDLAIRGYADREIAERLQIPTAAVWPVTRHAPAIVAQRTDELAARGLTVRRSELALPEPPRLPDWTLDAACTNHDPALWHPENHSQQHTARLICATCPVRATCLAERLTEPYGIIGGLTTRDRAALLGITTADAKRPPHATRSRFIGSNRWTGCRCTQCHASHAAYERDARARRRTEAGDFGTAYRGGAEHREPTIDPALPARDDHPPRYARIEFDHPDLDLLTQLSRAHRHSNAIVETWHDSGLVIEHEDPATAEHSAVTIAADLVTAGVVGWRLYDTAGQLIYTTGHRAPHTPGDTTPGWWTRARLPWPGQPWTDHDAAALLAHQIAAEQRPDPDHGASTVHQDRKPHRRRSTTTAPVAA